MWQRCGARPAGGEGLQLEITPHLPISEPLTEVNSASLRHKTGNYKTIGLHKILYNIQADWPSSVIV